MTGRFFLRVVPYQKEFFVLSRAGQPPTKYPQKDLKKKIMNWIDASKQLPPPNKNVLAIQKTGYKDNRVIIVANWIDRFTEEAEDIDFSEYSEEKDEYYLPSGWYENQYNWGDYSFIKVGRDSDITHWMLLPEKPLKEWYDHGGNS